MFKNLLITSLALLGAGTASAAVVDGEASQKMRVVIIWGDQFAAGTQYWHTGESPDPINLIGTGAFFGASDYATEARPRQWVAPSLTNGIDGSRNGLEWSAAISFMGKRLTGDPVLVINLATPGSDVGSRYHLYTDRWMSPVMTETLGEYEMDPASTAVADLQTAISLLPTVAPPGTKFELSGIVFSCWNNFNQRKWEEIARQEFSGECAPGELAEFQATVDFAAYKQCDAIEATFRKEFGLILGASGYSLTSKDPRIVGFRRHNPEADLGAAGGPFIEGQVFEGGYLPVNRDLNQLIIASHSTPTTFIDPPVVNPRTPARSDSPTVYGWNVTFVGDMDALQTFDPMLQSNEVGLSPKANHFVGLHIGSALFN